MTLVSSRGIKEKEIVKKLRNKGIFTVTSCHTRFGRKKEVKRSNPRIIKYYHALKALGFGEKRIYVVGKPELNHHEALPYILTSEGTPDRDSYYLIGMRIPAPPLLFNDLFGRMIVCGTKKNIWKDFCKS